MGDGSELEIKLGVSDTRLFDVIQADSAIQAMAQSKSPLTRTFEALYFDTPTYSLKKNGFSFRVRKEGDEWVATVKVDAGSSGGFSTREEWNEQVSGPEAVEKCFSGTNIGERLAKTIGSEKLQLLFTSRFIRTTLLLRTENGALVEMAMDRGTIWGGIEGTPISELELELKEGQTSQLLELASWVVSRWHLLPEPLSKYARGIRLLQHGEGVDEELFREYESKAPEYPLLSVLADSCIDAVFASQASVVSGGATVEGIRQLRIGCRRLRSLLKFYQPRLNKEGWQTHSDRLRQWGTLLGGIRDIDVLEKAWEQFSQRFSPVLQLSNSWLHLLADRREFLSAEVVHRLNRGELVQTLFDLQAWIYQEKEARSSDNEGSVSDSFVRKSLSRTIKTLREDIIELESADNIKTLHQLRIRIKRLRYFMEELSIIPRYRSTEFLSVLQNLQTSLGKINDAFQIKSLLDQIDAGSSDEKFILEKELFVSWRSRQTAERVFSLRTNMELFRKAAKSHLRVLSSLRTRREGKASQNADPHEPGE